MPSILRRDACVSGKGMVVPEKSTHFCVNQGGTADILFVLDIKLNMGFIVGTIFVFALNKLRYAD